MNDFTKCPNGHVYDSELGECPYCNGEDLDDNLKKLPRKEIEPPESAMCYDMGPQDFSDNEEADEEETDEEDKFPKIPIPPTCYMPPPPPLPPKKRDNKD